MEIIFLILLFVLGACFGSFLCCQARRLKLTIRKNTLRNIRRSRPRTRGAAPATAGGRDLVSERCFSNRSCCLHCGYQLKWYDNLPIISWIALRGKCRKCHKKIGYAEIISELALAGVWLALGLTFNYKTASTLDWCIFIGTLLLSLPLMYLAIYDGLYGELPVAILVIAIILAAVVLALKEWQWLASASFSLAMVLDPLGAILILSGVYLLLYLVSRGAWVGDGDWLLGLALGLALSNAWSALIALFVANFSATIIMLPAVKKHKNHKIPFGPFLVLGFFIALIMI